VEDHFAVVPLQNLLDHTTRRIVQSNLDLEAKMFQIAEQNGGQLSATLYYKYHTTGQCSQMLQEISHKAKHLIQPKWYL
jgi:hypothetical protein